MGRYLLKLRRNSREEWIYVSVQFGQLMRFCLNGARARGKSTEHREENRVRYRTIGLTESIGLGSHLSPDLDNKKGIHGEKILIKHDVPCDAASLMNSTMNSSVCTISLPVW